MTWLNVNTVYDHSATTNINDTLVRLPKQFIWERDSSLKFRTALQSRDIQRMIHDFLVDNNSLFYADDLNKLYYHDQK